MNNEHKKKLVTSRMKRVRLERLFLAAVELYGCLTMDDIVRLCTEYGISAAQQALLEAADGLMEDGLLEIVDPAEDNLPVMFFHPVLFEEGVDLEQFVDACLENELVVFPEEVFFYLKDHVVAEMLPEVHDLIHFLIHECGVPEEDAVDFVYDTAQFFQTAPFNPLLAVAPVMEYEDLFSIPDMEPDRQARIREMLVNIAESIPVWMAKGEAFGPLLDELDESGQADVLVEEFRDNVRMADASGGVSERMALWLEEMLPHEVLAFAFSLPDFEMEQPAYRFDA